MTAYFLSTCNMVINKKEYKVKSTLRSMMLFEQATKRKFQLLTLTDQIIFCYCMLAANNENFDVTFDSFLDYCDKDINIISTIMKEVASENTSTEEAELKKK